MDVTKFRRILSQMHKNLECAICLELARNPVSTKCGHQFCKFCLDKFLERKRSSVPCPLCKEPITKRGLQDRHDLQVVVSKFETLLESFDQETSNNEIACESTRPADTQQDVSRTEEGSKEIMCRRSKRQLAFERIAVSSSASVKDGKLTSPSRKRDGSQNFSGNVHGERDQELVQYIEEGLCRPTSDESTPQSEKMYDTDHHQKRERSNKKNGNKSIEGKSRLSEEVHSANLGTREPISTRRRYADKLEKSYKNDEVVEERNVKSTSTASPALSMCSGSSTEQLLKPIQAVSRTYAKTMKSVFGTDGGRANWAESLPGKEPPVTNIPPRSQVNRKLANSEISGHSLSGLTTKEKIKAVTTRAKIEKKPQSQNICESFDMIVNPPKHKSIFKSKNTQGETARVQEANVISEQQGDIYEFQGNRTPVKGKKSGPSKEPRKSRVKPSVCVVTGHHRSSSSGDEVMDGGLKKSKPKTVHFAMDHVLPTQADDVTSIHGIPNNRVKKNDNLPHSDAHSNNRKNKTYARSCSENQTVNNESTPCMKDEEPPRDSSAIKHKTSQARENLEQSNQVQSVSENGQLQSAQESCKNHSKVAHPQVKEMDPHQVILIDIDSNNMSNKQTDERTNNVGKDKGLVREKDTGVKRRTLARRKKKKSAKDDKIAQQKSTAEMENVLHRIEVAENHEFLFCTQDAERKMQEEQDKYNVVNAFGFDDSPDNRLSEPGVKTKKSGEENHCERTQVNSETVPEVLTTAKKSVESAQGEDIFTYCSSVAETVTDGYFQDTQAMEVTKESLSNQSIPPENKDYKESSPAEDRNYKDKSLAEDKNYEGSSPTEDKNYEGSSPTENKNHKESVSTDNKNYEGSSPPVDQNCKESSPQKDKEHQTIKGNVATLLSLSGPKSSMCRPNVGAMLEVSHGPHGFVPVGQDRPGCQILAEDTCPTEEVCTSSLVILDTTDLMETDTLEVASPTKPVVAETQLSSQTNDDAQDSLLFKSPLHHGEESSNSISQSILQSEGRVRAQRGRKRKHSSLSADSGKNQGSNKPVSVQRINQAGTSSTNTPDHLGLESIDRPTESKKHREEPSPKGRTVLEKRKYVRSVTKERKDKEADKVCPSDSLSDSDQEDGVLLTRHSKHKCYSLDDGPEKPVLFSRHVEDMNFTNVPHVSESTQEEGASMEVHEVSEDNEEDMIKEKENNEDMIKDKENNEDMIKKMNKEDMIKEKENKEDMIKERKNKEDTMKEKDKKSLVLHDSGETCMTEIHVHDTDDQQTAQDTELDTTISKRTKRGLAKRSALKGVSLLKPHPKGILSQEERALIKGDIVSPNTARDEATHLKVIDEEEHISSEHIQGADAGHEDLEPSFDLGMEELIEEPGTVGHNVLQEEDHGSDHGSVEFDPSPGTSSPKEVEQTPAQDLTDNGGGGDDDDNNDDDDDDIAVNPRRKMKKQTIETDSEESKQGSGDEEDDQQGVANTTSSSAVSSQSELLNTQQQEVLEGDLAKLRQEIAQYENQLAIKNGETSNNRKDGEESWKDDVFTVDDSPETSEGSDDLFVSASPQRPPKRSVQVRKPALLSTGTQDEIMKQFQSPGGTIRTKMALDFKPKHSAKAKKDEVITSDAGQEEEIEEPASPVLSSQRQASCTQSVSKTSGQLHHARHDQTKLCFVASGLSREDSLLLYKLVEQCDATFSSKFDNNATHVIMKTVEEGSLVCDRTLKFFQGIAHSCWILSFHWVLQSLKAGHLLSEVDFEICGDTMGGEDTKGPMKSRLSTSPLFESYCFACVGNSEEMSKENLCDLLTSSGAKVMDSPVTLMSSNDRPHRLIVRCTGCDEEPAATELDMYNGFYQHMGLHTVMREWILDSLGCYSCLPITEYTLTSS